MAAQAARLPPLPWITVRARLVRDYADATREAPAFILGEGGPTQVEKLASAVRGTLSAAAAATSAAVNAAAVAAEAALVAVCVQHHQQQQQGETAATTVAAAEVLASARPSRSTLAAELRLQQHARQATGTGSKAHSDLSSSGSSSSRDWVQTAFGVSLLPRNLPTIESSSESGTASIAG